MNFSRTPRIAAALSAAVLILGCESNPTLYPSEASLAKKSAPAHASTEELLKIVRPTAARFHSVVQAERAGYAEDHHCVAVPGLGGMGHHWANENLFDDIFDPLQPEVLLYAPGPNGKPQLVAVEYVVIDTGQPRPHFGSQPFDIGGTPIPVPHWSLHVWLYETNPSGTFAPFNPNVHCH